MVSRVEKDMTDKQLDFLLVNALKKNSEGELSTLPPENELAGIEMSARHQRRMEKLFKRARRLEWWDSLFSRRAIISSSNAAYTADEAYREENLTMKKIIIACGLLVTAAITVAGVMFLTNNPTPVAQIDAQVEAREIIIEVDAGWATAPPRDALFSADIQNDYFTGRLGPFEGRLLRRDRLEIYIRVEETQQYFMTDGKLSIIYANASGVQFEAEPQNFWSEISWQYREYNGGARRNSTTIVTYNFGECLQEQFSLPMVLSYDTFYEINDRLAALVEEGIIDIPTWRIFINNHTRLNYQMMVDGLTIFCPVEYREGFPNLPYMGYVYMLKPMSNRLINEVSRLYQLAGFGLEDMRTERAKFGVEVNTGQPLFAVALVYELYGNSILVYIDAERTTWPEGYTIEKVNLYGMFGMDKDIYLPLNIDTIIRFVFPRHEIDGAVAETVFHPPIPPYPPIAIRPETIEAMRMEMDEQLREMGLTGSNIYPTLIPIFESAEIPTLLAVVHARTAWNAGADSLMYPGAHLFQYDERFLEIAPAEWMDLQRELDPYFEADVSIVLVFERMGNSLEVQFVCNVTGETDELRFGVSEEGRLYRR